MELCGLLCSPLHGLLLGLEQDHSVPLPSNFREFLAAVTYWSSFFFFGGGGWFVYFLNILLEKWERREKEGKKH